MIKDHLTRDESIQLGQIMRDGIVEAGKTLDGNLVQKLFKLGLIGKNKDGHWIPNWDNIGNWDKE